MPERDPIEGLRSQLDAAHAAAERVVREAEAAARETAADVPPRGWETPAPETPLPDLSALVALLEGMRGLVPPELARQLGEAVRELLLALRALIDWYLERLGEPAKGDEPEVEDIPLD